MSDIFSIIGDNTLQRKTMFSETPSNEENLQAEPKPKLVQYLSLVRYEMNELNNINEHKFDGDSLPLDSAHVELGDDEVKLHHMTCSNFLNFTKSPAKLRTIVQDESDPNSIKILYKTVVETIEIRGLAEIKGMDYDFEFDIVDLTLNAEYEQVLLAGEGKIKTKFILETLTFKNFTVPVMLSDGNKLVGSSLNKQILRRLADSWMVTIVNAVNYRFLRAKIIEQIQLYFKTYKNDLLQDIGSSILAIRDEFKSIREITDINVKEHECKNYVFWSILFKNLEKFEHGSENSMSTQLKKIRGLKDDYFTHVIVCNFPHSSAPKLLTSTLPSINWTLSKSMCKAKCCSPTYHEIRVKFWSVTLKIFTDNSGKKSDEEMTRVNVDFDLENDGSEKLDDYYVNKFLGLYKKSLAEIIKLKVDSTFLKE